MGSICLFSLANGEAWQWLTFWFVFGLISVSIKSTIWTTAVVSVFQRSRGLALGLTLSGTAVAQAVVPPLGNLLIVEFGWRAAFVWLGLGWGGVTLLLATLFFFDDRTARLQSAKAGLDESVPKARAGLTVSEATRDSAAWRLAISNFIVMALTMGLAIHLFPILTEAGVSRSAAALLVGLSGVAGIVGKLFTGFLLDHFRPNWVGGITLGAASIALILLIDGIRSPTLVVLALLVNGYAAGTKTHITGFLTAGYAGMKNFGAIYGLMSSLMALAAGVGPVLAGYIYDTSGDMGCFS